MGRGKLKAKRPKLEQEEEAAASFPPWIDLPKDLTENILHRLGAVEILENAQKVCSTWLKVCKAPEMWRVIDMGIQSYEVNERLDLWKMCYEALERSQGQLIDINIVCFGDDRLLYRIEGKLLKRLRITSCYGISGKHLALRVTKFPVLEELHLFDMESTVSAGNVEKIGLACPTLKSFTFNEDAYHGSIKTDALALAVSKSMPGLLHLKLCGNKMTSKGLKAILDGCPHLESLDIRECFNVVLEDGGIGTRCSRQIKNLKRPLDSTADDDWTAICNSDQCVDKIMGRIYENEPVGRGDPYIFRDPYSSASDSDDDYYYDYL